MFLLSSDDPALGPDDLLHGDEEPQRQFEFLGLGKEHSSTTPIGSGWSAAAGVSGRSDEGIPRALR